MTVKERIALALERANKSQRDLARYMGLSSPTVSAMLSKDDIDSIKYLKAVEDITGFSFEWLRTGADESQVNEPEVRYGTEIQTLRRENKELKDLNEKLKHQLEHADSLIREFMRGSGAGRSPTPGEASSPPNNNVA